LISGDELGKSLLRWNSKVVPEIRGHVRGLEGINFGVDIQDLVVRREPPVALDLAVSLVEEQHLLLGYGGLMVLVVGSELVLASDRLEQLEED
jgi:hypothetical protein